MPGLILRVGKKPPDLVLSAIHSNGGYPPQAARPLSPQWSWAPPARRPVGRSSAPTAGLPTEAPAPHPRSAEVLTLGDLFDKYETLRKREGRKIKTLDEAMRLLRRNLAPYLPLPADQFSKADLRAARDAMVEADAMIAGNRLLQRLGPVLKWAAQEDLIPANFTPDIRKAPEEKRTRKLTDAEIREIWHACGDVSAAARRQKTSAAWCRFLLLTAQRRGRGGLASASAISWTASGGRPRTSRAGRTASSYRRWRWSWSGRAGRATLSSPAASARSAASRN